MEILDLRSAFSKTGLELTEGSGLTKEQLDQCTDIWQTKRSEWSDEFKQFYKEYLQGDLSTDAVATTIVRYVLRPPMNSLP